MAITIAGNFGLTSSKALDDRCVVDTFSTLISGSYTGTNTYKGMQVYVTDEDAYYKLNTQLDAGVAIDSADYWDQVTALDATPSVDSAEKDGDGNVITDTYLPLTGGTMTGNVTFSDEDTTIDISLSGVIKISSEETLTISSTAITGSDNSVIDGFHKISAEFLVANEKVSSNIIEGTDWYINDGDAKLTNITAETLDVDEINASNIVHKITGQRIWLDGIYDKNNNLLSNNLGIGLGTDNTLAIHFIDTIYGGDIDYTDADNPSLGKLTTSWSITEDGYADFVKTTTNTINASNGTIGELYFKGHYIYGSGVSGDTSGGWLRLFDDSTSTQLGFDDFYIKIDSTDGFLYYNGSTGTENIKIDTSGLVHLISDASMDIEAYGGNINIIAHSNNDNDSDIYIAAGTELLLKSNLGDSSQPYILLDDTVSIHGPASSFINFESDSGKINIQPGTKANLYLNDRKGTNMLQIQNDTIKLRNSQGTNFLISGTTIASETEGISFTSKAGEDIYFLLDRTDLSGWKVTNVSGGDLVIQTDGLITDGVESKNTAFADVITFDLSEKEIVIASDWTLEIPGNLVAKYITATGGIEVDIIQAYSGTVISIQNDIEVDAVVTATTLQGSLSTDYLTTGDDELIIDCGNASA